MDSDQSAHLLWVAVEGTLCRLPARGVSMRQGDLSTNDYCQRMKTVSDALSLQTPGASYQVAAFWSLRLGIFLVAFKIFVASL